MATADPTFGYTLEWVQVQRHATNSGISGVGSCSRSNPLVEAAGTYSNVITCVPNTLTAPNYTFATGTSATFTINQAALTITVDRIPTTSAADHFTRPYGYPNPRFMVRDNGFVLGDTPLPLAAR